MFDQLRGILARAQQCAKGHDVDGVQSALVEAELELNAVEAAAAPADLNDDSADDVGAAVDAAPYLDGGDVSPLEPGAVPDDGGGIHPNAPAEGAEEQADGASEPPPPQVFQ